MSRSYDPENPFKKQNTTTKSSTQKVDAPALKMEFFFSTAGLHPFEQIEWETRSAKISSDTGEAIFEQNDIELPASPSQLATKVVASKYFFGDIEISLWIVVKQN